MLSHVEISNYRGFQKYAMSNLTRVNLLVGKNNSGKTALLEGIQFLTSRGDPTVLAEVADRRGEVIVGRSHDPSVTIVDIAHFFHGHLMTNDCSFAFIGDNGYPPITVRIQASKSGKGDAREPREEKVSPNSFFLRITSPDRPERDEPRFAVSREGGVYFEVPSRFRRIGSSRRSRAMRFVGADSLNTIDLATMWDEITLGRQEVDVAEAMRVLDPNVESLHFLTGMLASGFFPSRGGIVVGIRGQETRVPLGSMGDGMRRLMALATALAFSKAGCLFVDEIDTGLHYSVMRDMWRLVVEKAVASDTQVFATTHSWDCIAGLANLCTSDPTVMPKVAIHKIDRAIPHSVPFSGGAIVQMSKSDIDPR